MAESKVKDEEAIKSGVEVAEKVGNGGEMAESEIEGSEATEGGVEVAKEVRRPSVAAIEG